tara:strand:+ start:632 stop:1036 length:405 start_codon:yes stop_codon:yes gene_type:complete
MAFKMNYNKSAFPFKSSPNKQNVTGYQPEKKTATDADGTKYRSGFTGTAMDKKVSAMTEYRQGNLPYHLMNRRDRRMEKKRQKALGHDTSHLKGPHIFQRIRNIGRAGFSGKDIREQKRKDKKYGSSAGSGHLL